MKKRIAQLGIVVEDYGVAERVNTILHQYGAFIIGRMGIPYCERGIAVISIVLDAPDDIINALAGKLGMIPGVNSKTIYSKVT